MSDIEQFISLHYPVDTTGCRFTTISTRGNTIVSVCVYKIYDEKCHIVAVVTIPEYRNNGFATKIINSLIDKYKYISLNVLLSESHNIIFWKKKNFKIIAVNMNEGYVEMEYSN